MVETETSGVTVPVGSKQARSTRAGTAPARRWLLAAMASVALLGAACAAEDEEGPAPAEGAQEEGASTAESSEDGTEEDAVTFDPPEHAVPVDYPPQPDDVPWPTDGWAEGTLPEDVDETAVRERLDVAFGEQSEDPAARFHAVLLVHGGEIVEERYHPEAADEGTVHPSWSIAKSVTQALIGVLVRDGHLDITEPAPVEQWDDPDDPRSEITTEMLLHMTDGLRFDEDYFTSGSDVLEMLGGEGSDDMPAFAADMPLENDPGERMVYSTGTSNILAGIIGDEVGRGDDYRAFIDEELLDPLGIDDDQVDPGFDGAGNLVGGAQFNMTARAYAKFGLLYLRGGRWEDEQLLPEGWIDHARTPAPEPVDAPGYGAQWWIDTEREGVFNASGFGGQRITVAPDRDLVIVVLSNRFDQAQAELTDDLLDAFDPS